MGGNLLVTALPGLSAGVPIVDAQGAPTAYFLTYIQQITSGLANSSGASMPTPPTVTIQTDYTGAILPNQLPYAVIVSRYLNGVDVSAKCRWFISTASGSISSSISQSGAVTISSIGSSSVLVVKSVRDNLTLTCNLTVNLSNGAPPTSGSGGSTSTGTTFNSISSTSYASPITTADISVTVGTSGIVNLATTLSVRTAKTAEGTYPVWGKWQWYNGTAWVDVGTEVESSPSCTVNSRVQDTVPPSTVLTETTGSLNISASQSGLTAASTQKFRVMARNDTTIGTQTMTFSGTVSAVPQ